MNKTSSSYNYSKEKKDLHKNAEDSNIVNDNKSSIWNGEISC